MSNSITFLLNAKWFLYEIEMQNYNINQYTQKRLHMFFTMFYMLQFINWHRARHQIVYYQELENFQFNVLKIT